MAQAAATVRANFTAFRTLSLEARTNMLAQFPEVAQRAVFSKFPDLAGATTAATRAPPLLALPLPPTRPDPTATGRALAEATEAKLRARIRALEAAATAATAETTAKAAAADSSARAAAAATATAEATATAAPAEAAATPFVPPDMDALLARIAALENPPCPAAREPAADEGGPAHALGM